MPVKSTDSAKQSANRPTPDDVGWLMEFNEAISSKKRQDAVFVLLVSDEVDDWRFRAGVAAMTGKAKAMTNTADFLALRSICLAAKGRRTNNEAPLSDDVWDTIGISFGQLLEFGIGRRVFTAEGEKYEPTHPIGELVGHALAYLWGGVLLVDCEICGRPFIARRSSASVCSSTCGTKAHRKKPRIQIQKAAAK